jgi:phosphopantothenoylcysteine decarboxylase/phosphopantothenate--cysteine ligase
LGKLKSKHADCIILNSLQDKGAGFGVDTNVVTVLNASGEEMEIPLKSKKEIAKDIVSFIALQIHG